MKKLIVLFIGLFILALPMFGQTPDSIWNIISNLGMYLGSPEAFALAVPVVGAVITGLLKVEKNWSKRLVIWGLAIVGLIAADLSNFGYVAEYPIGQAAIDGLFIGFAANGIFTIPQVKPFMDKIHELFLKLSTKIVPSSVK